MANWYGTSRSNYVRISDMGGLRTSMEKFGLEVCAESGDPNIVAFFPNDMSDSGGWPGSVIVSKPNPDDPTFEDDEELEFDFAEHIMPFVAEGEVLVVMSVGAEKSRYVTGYSEAFIRKGEEISRIALNIDEIYIKAAVEFKVTAPINSCSY